MKRGSSIIGCTYCKSEYSCDNHRFKLYKNHFCSMECKGLWMSENLKTKNNPGYSRIIVKCDECNNLLLIIPHRKKHNQHNFCNKRCYGKWRSQNTLQDKNTTWKSKEVKCLNCNTKFFRSPSLIKDKIFCTSECWKEYVSGENHHCWKGGKIPYQQKSWKEIRIVALNRDDNECMNCKATENLHVHHLISYRKSKDHGLNNLVVLCVKCHPYFEHKPLELAQILNRERNAINKTINTLIGNYDRCYQDCPVNIQFKLF